MRSVVLVALVVCGCGKPAADPAGPKDEGGRAVSAVPAADMTYKDLLEKLKAGGLAVRMAPSKYGQVYVISSDTKDDPSAFADNLEFAKGSLVEMGRPYFVATKHESTKAAKDEADRHEAKTWAWGQFSFRATDDTLSKLKKALAR
jgi:hypothetical protein